MVHVCFVCEGLHIYIHRHTPKHTLPLSFVVVIESCKYEIEKTKLMYGYIGFFSFLCFLFLFSSNLRQYKSGDIWTPVHSKGQEQIKAEQDPS
jgi:hypothetical protein